MLREQALIWLLVEPPHAVVVYYTKINNTILYMQDI